MCLWQQPAWPALTWDDQSLSALLARVSRKQGHLLGKMEALGFGLRDEAHLRTLTEDRLFAWHDDNGGPMQVVSGPMGRETVHYEAPPADHVRGEVADMALARSEGSPKRFYSLSAQFQLERNDYFANLEWTQKGEILGAIREGCTERSPGKGTESGPRRARRQTHVIEVGKACEVLPGHSRPRYR
jgi:Domain of unknown function (DUF4172)